MNTATTDERQSASTTNPTRYMWLITVQWPQGGGFGSATFSSTADIPAGASRMDVYMQICEIAKEKTGAHSLNVMFFALEPDQLNG
ncbi:hypothetical protein [Nonomuraea longispora]|uniref:hypothetical protein n=1 Tax=Nonomuraea longispora TaxID=1848320 RepID=UPI0014051264|nr:hypothetical protein [Nonomuraea longispora]